MNGLFDIIKIIFTNPVEYNNISRGEKQKNYFLLNRRFAINFPLQANALQHLKINHGAVIDFWQVFLRKQYKYVPNWMYISGVKKTQEVKETKTNINSSLIKEYAKFMKMDIKRIYDAIELFPNDMLKEIKDFEKMMKQT